MLYPCEGGKRISASKQNVGKCLMVGKEVGHSCKTAVWKVLCLNYCIREPEECVVVLQFPKSAQTG